MSMREDAQRSKALERVFNLDRWGEGLDGKEGSNGYPTDVDDFDAKNFTRYVTADMRIGGLFLNTWENDDGTVDHSLAMTLTVCEEGHQAVGDSCNIKFGGLDGELWDDEGAELSFPQKLKKTAFRDVLCGQVFPATGMDPGDILMDMDYGEAIAFVQANWASLANHTINGNVKLNCYKWTKDPSVLKGPYASLVRAKKPEGDYTLPF